MRRLLALLLPLRVAAGAQPVHLVFALIDDLGWNDIGFRDPLIRSPTLDALARDGVVLDRHYVYRYCSPTRGSLMSGRLPYHAHQTNPGGESPWGANPALTFLPAKLKRAGYATHMRGKWHLGFSREEEGGYDSFRHCDDLVGIVRGHDPSRGLFLYASLHVVHNPIEAPAEFEAPYAATGWCTKRRSIAAMVSVADNVTARLVGALRAGACNYYA
eukprot:gene15113-18472_t